MGPIERDRIGFVATYLKAFVLREPSPLLGK